VGAYVYGDFCSGEVFLHQNGTSSVALDTGLNISSFGEDESGELYVVGLGGTVHRIASPTQLSLSISTNNGSFRTADSLTVSVGVENPSLSDVVVDFYFGVVMPDGNTVVFFTDLAFASEVGSLADPATLRPIVGGVDLTNPLSFSQPSFFTYLWTGGEPPGGYVLFVAAVKPGAFGDHSIDPGDIVALSTVAVSFAP
jgi:hypothetical protein